VFLEHFCWSEKVRVFGNKRGLFKFCGHFKCIPHFHEAVEEDMTLDIC